MRLEFDYTFHGYEQLSATDHLWECIFISKTEISTMTTNSIFFVAKYIIVIQKSEHQKSNVQRCLATARIERRAPAARANMWSAALLRKYMASIRPSSMTPGVVWCGVCRSRPARTLPRRWLAGERTDMMIRRTVHAYSTRPSRQLRHAWLFTSGTRLRPDSTSVGGNEPTGSSSRLLFAVNTSSRDSALQARSLLEFRRGATSSCYHRVCLSIHCLPALSTTAVSLPFTVSRSERRRHRTANPSLEGELSSLVCRPRRLIFGAEWKVD